jgi:hypothetical protein
MLEKCVFCCCCPTPWYPAMLCCAVCNAGTNTQLPTLQYSQEVGIVKCMIWGPWRMQPAQCILYVPAQEWHSVSPACTLI